MRDALDRRYVATGRLTSKSGGLVVFTGSGNLTDRHGGCQFQSSKIPSLLFMDDTVLSASSNIPPQLQSGLVAAKYEEAGTTISIRKR